MTIAYIGIGSNVGERRSFCRAAVEELRAQDGVEVVATSSLYETSPIGGPPQRSYINAVVKVDVKMSARELLELCQGIENRVGREPSDIRWGPRVLDLDILLFDDEKVNEPDLEIPHPRMGNRSFVLIPLTEIDEDVADPWGMRYRDLLDEAQGDVALLEEF